MLQSQWIKHFNDRGIGTQNLKKGFPMGLAKYILLSLCLVLLNPLTVFGQGVRKITLQEAAETALEQNILLKKSENQLNFSLAQRAQQRAAFLPNMNFNTSSTRDIGRTFNQSIGEVTTATTNFFSGSISTNLNVFNGFADVAALKQSEFDVLGQYESIDRSREGAVFTVASQFLQVLLDKELLQIAQEDLKDQKTQLTQIEESVQTGTRPVSDLYNQQAQVAQRELNVIDAENRLRIDQTRLVQTIQLDPREEYEFIAPELDGAELKVETYNLEELFETALKNRSDFKRSEYNVEAAKQGIRRARSGYLPRINLNYTFGSSYNNLQRRGIPLIDPETGEQAIARDYETGEPIISRFTGSVTPLFTSEETPISDQVFDENTSHRISLSISLPIFDRFTTRTNVQNSKVQLRNAELDRQDLEKTILFEVKQAYLDYLSSQKRLESTDAQLKASEKALETERERYNLGASTLVELTTANSNYVQAASGRVQAEYRFLFQKKILDYHLGKLSSDISIK